MATPNFKRNVGRLALDRFDFESHLKGENPSSPSSFATSFRHQASQIDIDNPSLTYGDATDVQSAFENINDFITLFSSSGQGFVTVGDGYNTWHNANNLVNFDPAIPSLDTLLNPIFRAIYDGYDGYQLLDSYERVQNGGIIVIKAGTYIVKDTINVPPGITLLGEGYGTKIINATALTIPAVGIAPSVRSGYFISNITSTSPIQVTTSIPNNIQTGETVIIADVDGLTGANGTFTVTRINNNSFFLNNSSATGTWGNHGVVRFARPVFKILPELSRSVNDAAVDPNLFMFSKSTKIMNMLIADNFVENTVLTDLFYKIPQNKLSEGLIFQESGSNLELNNVYFLGRANFSSGKIVSQITTNAVVLDTTNGIISGTNLSVENCFIDGFAQPIKFQGSAGVKDNFTVQNSKIRSHGYLNGNGTDQTNNCLFVTNDNNVLITGNTLYGNHDNCYTILYVADNLAGSIDPNAKSKLMITNNSFIVSRSGSSSITPAPYYVNPTLTTFDDKAYIVSEANFFDTAHGFNFSSGLNATAHLAVNSSFANITSGNIILNAGLLTPRMVTILTTTYAVDIDGGVPDYLLLVPTTEIFNTVGSITITMPSVTSGRILIIKDIENDTTPITVTAQSGEVIEDPDASGYSNSVTLNSVGTGSSYTYCGVLDTVNSVSKWVLISKYEGV